MNLPLSDEDEVVGTSRFARDNANGIEEQVLVFTRMGEVFTLTYDATGKYWKCREADVRMIA